MKVAIEKIEYYLPENKLDGEELLRDNPDWRIQDIEAKTGITRRYKAGIGESVIDMAEKAANKLFGDWTPQDTFVWQNQADVIENTRRLLVNGRVEKLNLENC